MWYLSNMATHEKMTLLGSRFLEKGRRSGSCFDVHSSMVSCEGRARCAEAQARVRVQGEVYGVSFYGGRSARAGIAALSNVLVRCVFGGPQTSEADMRGSVDAEQEGTR